MRIQSLSHALPSQRITTDWIVSKLQRVNDGRLTTGERAQVASTVRAFLEGAGSDTKYQLADGERATDVAAAAVTDALRMGGTAASDIEFLIYCGVGRGWLEPATATAMQHALSLPNATGFDVLDGCAGWLRALQVARGLIDGGVYRNGLILSCECGFADFGRWDFDRVDEIVPYLATYTIGEVATATVVCASDEPDNFYFRFHTFGEHADLCMIPLPNSAAFLKGPSKPDRVPMRFYADSGALMKTATQYIIELFQRDETLRSHTYDAAFGHAASRKASEAVRQAIGVATEAYYETHPEYGNTVSSSVPLGMSLALQSNKLVRGDRTLIVVAGSGITIGAATFTF